MFTTPLGAARYSPHVRPDNINGYISSIRAAVSPPRNCLLLIAGQMTRMTEVRMEIVFS